MKHRLLLFFFFVLLCNVNVYGGPIPQSEETKTLRYYTIDSTLYHAVDSLLNPWYESHSDHGKHWAMSLTDVHDDYWRVTLSQCSTNRISEKALGYTFYNDYLIEIYGEIVKTLLIPQKKYKLFKLIPPDHAPSVFDPPTVYFVLMKKSKKVIVTRNVIQSYMEWEKESGMKFEH